MPGIRVLAEALPPAKSAAETPLRDYLTRLREELEFLLTHLEADNLGPELTKTLAGKQDALTYDDAPVSGSENAVTSGAVADAIAADHGLVRLNTAAVNVSTDTTVTLSGPANDFTLLVIYGTAGGTAAGNRFSVVVPVAPLNNSYFAPLAANNTLGALRLGLSGGDWTKLRFISQTFASMSVTAIYGKR